MNFERAMRGTARVPWVTTCIVASALCAFAVLDVHQLAYDPSEPRLATLLGCHLGHWSGRHLVFDGVAFALLGVVSERRDRGLFVAFVVATAILVPPVACAMHPGVIDYAGLSGLVIGQVGLFLAAELRVAMARRALSGTFGFAAAVAVLLGKQIVECVGGSVMGLEFTAFETVHEAHLVSLFIGLGLGAAIPSATCRWRTPSSQPCA